MGELSLLSLRDFPLIEPGDDLARIISAVCQKNSILLQNDDVLVLAQKIVSKAENRYADLNEITPSEEAFDLAQKTGKDPRHVELVLSQSRRVVRYRPGVIIVEHKLGFVHANAGIDHSNIKQHDGKELLLLLPEDPDKSARVLRENIKRHLGVTPRIIINDSFGRAWRHGTCGIAIGCAGFAPLNDLRGKTDLFGNILEITQVGIADEIAAAASLLMGQAAEGSPVVVVRGLHLAETEDNCQMLIRSADEDLFR
ncbi:MAG: coenzyme F420-0:L-glutamate ligase [Pseudomonadales bacterium]|nr:coenzyme F420-0:L-glutamate ligase [Pseudomonadales bacterium]